MQFVVAFLLRHAERQARNNELHLFCQLLGAACHVLELPLPLFYSPLKKRRTMRMAAFRKFCLSHTAEGLPERRHTRRAPFLQGAVRGGGLAMSKRMPRS